MKARPFIPSVITVLGLLCLTAAGVQEDAFTLKPVGAWPGYSRGTINAICAQSNYVYAAMDDGGITVLDFGKPSQPSLLGGCLGGKNAWEIVAQGRYVYVASGDDGLFIFDLSDPSKPKCVGSIRTLGSAVGLQVSGNTAYIADDGAGLVTVDVSNPAAPKLLGRAPTVGEAHGVSLFGHYACVADHDGGLQVIDVSQLEHPRRIGGFEVTGYASEIIVQGNYAFVSVSGNGVLVFDLSNTSRPTLVHTFSNCEDPWAVAIRDHSLYMYNAGDPSLEIWDIQKPDKPVKQGILSAHYAKQLVISGGFAYLLGRNEIQVMDLNALEADRPTGRYDGRHFTSDICVKGKYAYTVGGDSGLQVLDVSAPSNPKLVASLNIMTNTTTLIAEGNYLYVGADGSFWITDISHPAEPKVVSQCPLESDAGRDGILHREASQIMVTNGYAYVACGLDFDTVVVINVKNPLQPRLIKELRDDPFRKNKSVGGISQCIFLAKHIIDISDPSEPVLAGSLEESGMPQRSFCVPGYVFSPELLGELNIYDITKSGHQKTTYAFKDNSMPRDVYVKDGHAYLADYGGYLHLFDVRNPGTPKWLEKLKASGSALSVFAAGDAVYLANGANGIEIFQGCKGAEAEVARKARLPSTGGPSAPAASKIVRKLRMDKPAATEAPTLSMQEKEVIEAVLAHEFGAGTNMIVLMENTALGHASEYTPALKAPAEQEAEQDFLQKNRKASKIVWPGSAPKNVVLVPQQMMDGLFAGKHETHNDGWRGFYEQFPEGQGIAEISRVGIDSHGTVAIVYLGNRSHSQAGQGGICLLRLKGGKWIVEHKIASYSVSCDP